MELPRNIGTIHILGIGGIGMSAIAEILHAKGFSVQGSDQKDSANVKRLRAKGIRVFVGHDPVNLVGARYVVISTAVKRGNPELDAARAKGLPIIRRAEMLAELMRLYSTVSVTGTHGKTTTTSLISHVFAEAGLDPTVITGGIINDWGSNARLGKSEWMIVEADEFDGTFIKIPTQIGVVTNIDPEHLDYFKSVDNMHREYEAFLNNVPFYGLAVACIDHPVVRDMIARLDLRNDGRRLLTYGTSEGADLRLLTVHFEGSATVFDAELGPRVAGGARRLEGWKVPIPGAHNALNALAAIAVAAEARLSDDMIRTGLASFSGVKRRFQPTGTWNGIAIYDDYGHHPIEIAAVLKAAQARAPAAASSPWSSRTATPACATCGTTSAPASAMPTASSLPRSTPPASPRLMASTAAALAEGIRATGHPSVATVDSPRDIAPLLRHTARSGDIVVCLGRRQFNRMGARAAGRAGR